MSETNVQLFPGVFRTTQGGSNPDFFLHSAGRVGIGNDAPDTPPAWNTNTTFKLNVTGHTHVNGNLDVTGHLYGDGSTLSGVAAVVGGYWDLDQANNNIKYDVGNVGIGGAAGTEELTVHGDLNLNGGNLKLNGQTAVFSNWTSGTNSIYRSVGDVGIGISSPDEKLHVNGNIRLGGPQGTDEDADYYIKSAGQIHINSATDGAADDSYVCLDLRSGQSGSNRAGIGICGAATNTTYQHIAFETTDSERMRINYDGHVGIGTNSPQQNLHVHESGSGQVVIAVTNDTTGSGNNDGIHFGIDSSEQGFVWHKQNTALLFATNNTERMRIANGGSVGINTTNPHRTLDVQAPARPSTYPFAIGGSWSNRAEYVAKTYDPGTGGGSGYPTVDFVIGGGGQPGWARVMFAAWRPNNFPAYWGSVEISGIAEFTFGVEGTKFGAVREFGDGNISMASSGSHNGGRITISQTSSSNSTWRIWYEIYHEDGVYW